MSNLVVPNESKKLMLSRYLNGLAAGLPATIHLYQNNFTVGPTTVAGDLVEATFTGYVPGVLTGGTVLAGLNGSNRAVLQYNAVTFTKLGLTGNTIYGYWTADAAAALCWAETFDATIPMTVNGAFIILIPKITNKSQFANV